MGPIIGRGLPTRLRPVVSSGGGAVRRKTPYAASPYSVAEPLYPTAGKLPLDSEAVPFQPMHWAPAEAAPLYKKDTPIAFPWEAPEPPAGVAGPNRSFKEKKEKVRAARPAETTAPPRLVCGAAGIYRPSRARAGLRGGFGYARCVRGVSGRAQRTTPESSVRARALRI